MVSIWVALKNNPNTHPTPPPLVKPVQHRGTYPGEDWQVGFTIMPPCRGFRYLLVFLDTFAGWVEAFPAKTEKATELRKWPLKEIIPRPSLPLSLQMDNSPAFTAKITQNLSQTLDIMYKLHSAWSPQSSGKVERMNETLKRTLAKLCQGTQEIWVNMLPIALIRIWATPRGTLKLSLFELIYGRPFLKADDLSAQEM